MNDIIYLVYDGGDLVAGFVSLAAVVNFIEDWRHDSAVPVDLVDAKTGEVIDTWVNGRWDTGD